MSYDLRPYPLCDLIYPLHISHLGGSPGCCCFKRRRGSAVVVAGEMEADFERSLAVGVGYLGRGGVCRGATICRL